MKLKSLLLGSAAVLVAVSGARAADAIVVEPEPVEYVRVCDAYGAGFFYIPGTETCLRLSGYVRTWYGAGHVHDDVQDETSLHDAGVRARLNIDARNETEYGTLRSYIRFQGDVGAGTGAVAHNDVLSVREGPSDAGVFVDKAYIQLGGFTVGYHDDYWSRGLRYGYYEASNFDYAQYSYGEGLVLDYTYAANGWTFSVGAEDGRRSGEAGAPDLYAGFTYTGSGLFFGATVYNDSSVGAVAWRARMDYDFGNGFAMGGWYASDDGETDYVKGHNWGLTASYALTDTMVLWAGYSVFEDNYHNNLAANVCGVNAVQIGNANCGVDTSVATYTIGLDWAIVPQAEIQITYTGFDYENNTAFRRANGLVDGVLGIEFRREF